MAEVKGGGRKAPARPHGLAFPEHWPYAGEWWMTDPLYGSVVGFYFTGEQEEEILTHELGQSVIDCMEAENPPYPGWTP